MNLKLFIAIFIKTCTLLLKPIKKIFSTNLANSSETKFYRKHQKRVLFHQFTDYNNEDVSSRRSSKSGQPKSAHLLSEEYLLLLVILYLAMVTLQYWSMFLFNSLMFKVFFIYCLIQGQIRLL